ncbi:MAG: hypothetical protein HY318_16095 [Armatimonadetes bacterium]|nr:hypothetical protein [Armatimonadota bacterium]
MQTRLPVSPSAPVLGVITPAALPTVHVMWTWGVALNVPCLAVHLTTGEDAMNAEGYIT